MKTALATASLALGLLLSFPQPALAQTPAGSRQAIEGIVETFRKAIVDKDEAAFMKLFLREDIGWVGVYTDGSIDRYHAGMKDPKAARPPKFFSSSPRKFIANIAKASEPRAETFDNVRIESDGDVAQVWFDYSFLADGYRQNWGKESWQLVRTEAGWKIAAVVWSMEDNPVPRPAKIVRN
jgi:hypothetical protein